MRSIRIDLFICMVIATALFAGIFFVGDKLDLMEKIFDGLEAVVNDTKDVPDGEVGGYATDDTLRVSNVEELAAAVQEGKTFTVETSAVMYSNYGVFTGDNYDWRILKLDDDVCFAVKLNTKKIQNGDDISTKILPVGKLVEEAPGALEDMKEELADANIAGFIVDVYIDMDGEANSTYVSPNTNTVMIVLSVVMSALPLVLFVLYMVTIFAIHSIFVKKGIFPPVFPNKKI